MAESMRVVERTPVVLVGTVVWLASELMFFAGLFAAYFTLRAHESVWPPHGVELETAIAGAATVLLVVSSGTIQAGIRALTRGHRDAFRRWLVVTAGLGVVFLGNQVREWTTAGFGPDDHAFGSVFFVMTGFHALHVAGGLLAMGLLLGWSGDPDFDAGRIHVAEVVSYYWHVVDVVWLAMFAVLFLVG